MRTIPAVVVLALVMAACVAPADRARLTQEEAGQALEPSFSPLPDVPASTASEASASAPAASPGATTGAPPVTEPTATPAPGATLPSPSAAGSTRPGSAELEDPAGDVTGVSSPDWADLRSAELAREGSTFTLTHTADDDFPNQGDGTNTMNIATFFDVDGDGAIDYEIWANLSPDGWGTSYFDEREGTARYAAQDEVDVEVTEGAVRLAFPSSHLADARTFRWSIASEYGPYQAIGTDAMARDYLPDDRTGRPFPA